MKPEDVPEHVLNIGEDGIVRNIPAQRISRLLHARGREVTSLDVERWMNKIRDRWFAKHRKMLSSSEIADAIEGGHKTLTMCLHMEFGDSLDKEQGV